MSGNSFAVAFVSGKGGTGKTTLTANFAVELASALADLAAGPAGPKNRVLVIDNDYATGGASYLLAGGERLKSGAESEMIQPQTCFYDCYSQQIPPAEVTPLRLVFEDPSVGEFSVDVLLNSLGWWKTPLPRAVDESESFDVRPDASGEGFLDHNLLPYYEALLERFRSEYDYILIDSRGGADTRASVAAVVADGVIIVTEPGDVAGKQDMSFVRSLRTLAHEIDRSVGAVSVIYNRVLHTERDAGRQGSGDLAVIGRLPISENVIQCYRNTELIFEHRPLDPFCIAATRALEARFPGVQGVCQVRRRWAETLQRLRDGAGLAKLISERILIVLAFGTALGFSVLAGAEGEGLPGALNWARVFLPLTVLAGGCALAFELFGHALGVSRRPRRIAWLVGAFVALAAAAGVGFGVFASLSLARDVVS